MKLATLKDGRDGRLVVVSSDLKRCLPVDPVASTLQAALAAQPEQTSLQLDQIRDVLDDMLEELKVQNSGRR